MYEFDVIICSCFRLGALSYDKVLYSSLLSCKSTPLVSESPLSLP
jgi:hypothetical protein